MSEVADVSAINHLLLDHGICTDEQLSDVQEEHERTGTPYMQVIYNYGIIEEPEFLELVAENLGTQVVDVKEFNPDPLLIESIRGDVVRMYGILPLYEEDNRITVAALDPMNYRLIDELGYVLGKSVDIVVAKSEALLEAMDHFYPEIAGGNMDDVLNSLDNFDMEGFDDDDMEDIASQEAIANSTPIVRFVNVILYQAVKDQASDIHFEPFRDEFKIRYRIDGALYEMAPPPKHLSVPVISRLKVISGLNIAERKNPQDGRIELRVAGKKIDLRVSCLPTRYGESVVLRILDKGVVNLDIDALGMPDDIKTNLRISIRKPNGIILVTGPTGSGKTTTLYSCLNEINNIEDKILTAEDPVEYDIEGLLQVPVNEAIGMTFAKALKAFLRQDPDRIMLGEIRDLVTATIAIEAALTGHLVLSTLHTNDAPSAVTRLINMGVEPFLITSALECVIGQRLVRRICSRCKKYYDPPDDELESLDLTRDDVGENQFAYGEGCAECNNTGYKGRKGIYELFVMSQDLRKMIARREPAAMLTQKAKDEGMRSLREDGVRSIFTGETTVEEVLKYT
jgi:type IV pilus assembly protein PilB